ncbi:hypothetical protein BTN50_0326 [Candidatus Enterovibrio altilux]|uniref:Mobile element protein n=1 Tax=Candidatus Enterovibrio altilux TaxID=1927128 RepID=A0A291B784_9GAMM|nr:hypothetical protein BTN50_0326 [Candidatus Enterovibrio luxaltus]
MVQIIFSARYKSHVIIATELNAANMTDGEVLPNLFKQIR